MHRGWRTYGPEEERLEKKASLKREVASLKHEEQKREMELSKLLAETGVLK